MLHVDLKTIHNWVNQGHVSGRRTKGRHLRFDRTEVVRFMRAYGYQIPPNVGEEAPRVLLDSSSPLGGKLGRALKRSVAVSEASGAYAIALAASSGDQEVIVLDLDARAPREVQALLAALREWELTTGVVVLGVGAKPATRRAFLAAGGDIALAVGSEGDVRGIAKWLCGSADKLPVSAESNNWTLA